MYEAILKIEIYFLVLISWRIQELQYGEANFALAQKYAFTKKNHNFYSIIVKFWLK